MIEASSRRRNDPKRDAFELHTRLAGGESRHRRLTVGSVGAVAASLVAWLSGVPLAWHAGLLVAAFAVGMAWPVRRAREHALEWIAASSGLAYETALNHPEGDDWGFADALAERARAAALRIRAPKRRPWWIPAMAVALGLMLLPAAAQIGSTAGSDGVVGGPEAPAPLSPEPLSEDPLAPPEDVENDVDRAAEPEDTGGADGDAAAEDAAPGPGGEQEALSRLLDNLRERDPFRSVDAPEETADAAPRAQPSEEQPGDPSPGSGRERTQQVGEPDPDAEPGEPAPGQGEGSEGEQSGDQGEPGEGAGEGEEEGAPAPAAGEEQGEQAEGDTPAGGAEPSEGDGDGDLEPDASSGMGDAPSTPRPSEGMEQGPEQEPEFLPGQLDQGPETSGGSVLLPGEDEIDVPAELRSDTYRRAVEEAVTDGQVPLEYQEIIRNYFR